MNRKKWTESEAAYLRKYYPRKGAKYVALHLDRSTNAVISKAMNLGIVVNGFRHWEIREDNYIKRHYSDRKPSSIGKTLKRSIRAVLHRAQHLGLTKKRGRAWTDEEKKFLCTYYHDRSKSLEEIASQLRRSLKSVCLLTGKWMKQRTA